MTFPANVGRRIYWHLSIFWLCLPYAMWALGAWHQTANMIFLFIELLYHLPFAYWAGPSLFPLNSDTGFYPVLLGRLLATSLYGTVLLCIYLVIWGRSRTL